MFLVIVVTAGMMPVKFYVPNVCTGYIILIIFIFRNNVFLVSVILFIEFAVFSDTVCSLAHADCVYTTGMILRYTFERNFARKLIKCRREKLAIRIIENIALYNIVYGFDNIYLSFYFLF